MLNDFALNEAVKREIITASQRIDLEKLGQEIGHPLEEGSNANSDSEGFRFITGFSDVFLAIGAIILLSGLVRAGFGQAPVGQLIIAAVCLALSEIFVTWKKRSLPGMVSVLGFVAFGAMAISKLVFGIDISDSEAFSLTVGRNGFLLPATGLALSLAYYWRYRLPFSLFLAGLSFAAAIFWFIAGLSDSPEAFIIPTLLVTGLAIFGIAMRFDSIDRQRETRLSDNAFWLHLVASPLIVHSIMWQSAIWLHPTGRLNSVSLDDIAGQLSVAVLFIFLILMTVALIIDRRAMLVSSLIYVTLAIGYIASESGSLSLSASAIPVIIGSGVIAIGIGWQALRRITFNLLPLSRIEPIVPVIDRVSHI